MTVSIEGKDYHDGVDLTKERFYELLTTQKEFPKTSQPSPQEFLTYFEKVKEAGDELICFTISSALSGTCQSALLAKDMADYDKIHVIDTLGVTHMIGIMVEYAAKLRSQGFTALQIVEAVEKLKPRIKVFAGVDTLEYLRKGGRLSGAAAAVGSLAQIKPIVTITEEGKVDTKGKCIGKARAMQQIVEWVTAAEPDPAFPVLCLYSLGEENCELLEQRLKENAMEVSQRRQIGSTIGAHVGPGAYGVIFVTK